MAESMLNYCKKREQCLFLTYGSKYKMDVEMKLSIFEKKSIDETEVVINCKSRNPEIDKLAKHIIQYDESISCRRDGRDYNIRITYVLVKKEKIEWDEINELIKGRGL